ncbi:hypothetical protein N2152v2_007508 [Parachlorella kessleri]
MEFVVGTLIIVCPKQVQVPLLLGTTILKGFQGWHHKRRMKRRGTDPNLAQNRKEVTLEWDSLECTLTDKQGWQRILLDNLQGSARPGRLLAIMGPSGSGKTTLLTALAGQVPATKGMELRGEVAVNGEPLARAKYQFGFVQQEDIFYSQLTVKETLMMQAQLRLPREMTDVEKEDYVDGIIKRLGLSKAAETVVGDAKTRGLSGGEKKRLSIACELIAKPMLVFADEPTTGLDSFQAEKVMQALKDLTLDSHTVVVSIHQPRSSVFELFDDLILLSEGELVYSGPANEVLDYFAAQGYNCPEHYNPAEFLADLVALDHTSPEAEDESRARLDSLAAAWRARQHKEAAQAAAAAAAGEAALASYGDNGGEEEGPRCGLPRQVQLLFGRSWRQVTRDKPTNIGRAMSQISSAVVFAGIYWRLGRSPTSIQNRMGLLQVSAVGTAMTSLIKTLNVFPSERTIVNRERSRQGYQLLPYLLSKLAAELPISAVFPAIFASAVYPATGLHPKVTRFGRFLGLLVLESFTSSALGLAVGAAAPSTEAALAVGPAVILVSIVFGGLFVNEQGVPSWLAWVPKTSLIKQARLTGGRRAGVAEAKAGWEGAGPWPSMIVGEGAGTVIHWGIGCTAFEGMCINEFRGLDFEPEAGEAGSSTTGEQVGQRMGEEGSSVLHRLGFAEDTVQATALRQGRILLFYYFLTFNILKAKRPRYQKLLPPKPRALPPVADADAAAAELGLAAHLSGGVVTEGVTLA